MVGSATTLFVVAIAAENASGGLGGGGEGGGGGRGGREREGFVRAEVSGEG